MNRLPFSASIPKPCQQQWSAMSGSASARHCDSCQKTVHNFATLTPRQIERLVHETNGHLCARITRREDGSIVTASKETGFSRIALSTVLAIGSSTAFAQTTSPTEVQQSSPLDELPKTTTGVSGVVTDAQGALVVDAKVKLLLHDKIVGSTDTNEAGQFEFAVTPGDYQLQIYAPSFAPSSQALTVTSTQAALGNIALMPGVQVSVQVTALTIDSTTMGTMVATYGHWYRRLGYRLRHPVAYTKYILRHR